MYVFFNGVSSSWYIGLFDSNRRYITHKNFSISWNESTQTIDLIDRFLSENKIEYKDVDTIICVTWPGSFTWIRTITLVVNTLAYIYPHVSLHGINFFDLFSNYPVVKQSSKRDLFVKYQKNDIIQVEKNADFVDIFSWNLIYGDVDTSRFERDIECNTQIDYISILENLDMQRLKTLAPLYYKKPNIS